MKADIEVEDVFVICTDTGRSGYPDLTGRLRNPLTNDDDALQVAVSIPSINLQLIVDEAWRAEPVDHEVRRALVRRAIVDHGSSACIRRLLARQMPPGSIDF